MPEMEGGGRGVRQSKETALSETTGSSAETTPTHTNTHLITHQGNKGDEKRGRARALER